MKIKAELQPLNGKYYGSVIKLTNDKGGEAYIEVWINGVSDYKPSERELEAWKDGEYEICDDHFESQTAYEICQKIVEALNEGKPNA